MDDLTDFADLRRMRADLPGAAPEVLAAARTALLERLAQPPVVALEPRGSRHRRPGSRRLQVRHAAFAVTAAAAAIGTVFALTSAPSGPSDEAAPPVVSSGQPTTSPSTTGTQPGMQPPPAPPAIAHYVSAAQVLDTASARALANPPLAAGQYGHVRTHSLYVSQLEEPPDSGAYEFIEDRDDTWNPPSLSRPSLDRSVSDISVHFPTAKQRRYDANDGDGIPRRDVTWYSVDADGSPTPIAPPGPPLDAGCSNCGQQRNPFDDPSRRNLARLTTDRTQLRKELFAWARSQHADASKYGKPTLVNSLALKTINDIISIGFASPAQRATLFEIAKTIPGVKITGSMANYDGVRGTGIGLTDSYGVTQSLVFSPAGVYLGEKDVLGHPNDQYQLPAGTVLTWTAYRFDVTGRPEVGSGTK